MYNNVVSGVFNKFTQNGISCLRFNFRGVGKSSGKHTDGTGELNDAKTCIDFLLNEKHFEKIIICGYSYGAAIGCSVVNYSKNPESHEIESYYDQLLDWAVDNATPDLEKLSSI
ncbi:unnamed protein product [marine sediment metagenome]|uniref:Serine aminopeptidase S33 domain-containing protein n=1 Tax=marine sediment metagenome TaxID=412755 RepID=X1GFD9_9ZZZZ